MKLAIILIAVAIITLLSLNLGHAQESLSGIFTLNLADEKATYTESYDYSEEYGVEMTAHVEKSDCLKCLDFFYIKDCQAKGECLDVVVN